MRVAAAVSLLSSALLSPWTAFAQAGLESAAPQNPITGAVQAVQEALEPTPRWFGSFRTSVGATYFIGPSVVGVAGEVAVGARRVVIPGSGPFFDVAMDMGYAFDLSFSGLAYRHAFILGASPGVGTGFWTFRWSPHLQLGTAEGAFSVGVRNGLVAGYLRGLLEAELSHCYLRAGGLDHHSVRLIVGLDIGMFISAFSAVMNGLR